LTISATSASVNITSFFNLVYQLLDSGVREQSFCTAPHWLTPCNQLARPNKSGVSKAHHDAALHVYMTRDQTVSAYKRLSPAKRSFLRNHWLIR